MNKFQDRKILAMSGISLAAMLLANPAQAQSEDAVNPPVGLQDIIVTAERHSNTIQNTAASISAISGQDISQQTKLQVIDVLQAVPNVQVQGTARGFQVSIRGLGYDLAPGQGEGAVSYNDDGAYNNRQEAGRTGFYDVNRVEVLRGPQGTLYGRNATAGVVNVISNDPNLNQSESSAKVGLGNYNMRQAEGMVNTPLSDTFGLRAAFSFIDRDGFLSSGQGDLVASSGRLKALWQPSSDVSLLLGGQFTKTGGKGPGVVAAFIDPPAHPWEVIDTNLQSRAYDKTNYYKLWSKLDWDLGFGQLTILPSYQHQRNSSFYSNDGATFSQGSDPKYSRQTSAEVRLASKEKSSIKWLGGFFYYLNDSYNFSINPNSTLPNRQLNSSTNHLSSYAFFGETSVPLGDIVTVTGGLRYTHDNKTVESIRTNPSGVVTTPAFDQTYSRVDYKVNVTANITPTSMVYAQVATGYRPGGFTFVSTFAAEHLTAYEIGSKNTFFDRRLQLNLSAFQYHYPDYQVSNSTLLPGSTQLQISVVNTPVSIKGIEVESQFLLTPDDHFTTSFSYTPSRYKSLVLVSPGGAETPQIGFPVAHTPKYQWNAGYEHVFHLSGSGQFAIRGDLHYQSGSFVKPTENDQTYQKAYATENLGASYTSENGRWILAAFMNNVSNKVIKVGAPTPFASLAPPRTYGGSITLKFGENQ